MLVLLIWRSVVPFLDHSLRALMLQHCRLVGAFSWSCNSFNDAGDAGDLLGIDTSFGNSLAFTTASDGNRALLVDRNWRQLWLTKKDWWLMVAKVLGIGREMDGWSDLGCGERGGGKCLKVLIC